MSTSPAQKAAARKFLNAAEDKKAALLAATPRSVMMDPGKFKRDLSDIFDAITAAVAALAADGEG